MSAVIVAATIHVFVIITSCSWHCIVDAAACGMDVANDAAAVVDMVPAAVALLAVMVSFGVVGPSCGCCRGCMYCYGCR